MRALHRKLEDVKFLVCNHISSMQLMSTSNLIVGFEEVHVKVDADEGEGKQLEEGRKDATWRKRRQR